MRNRTEQVTNTLDGSDEEEEQLDSGGSDWHPEEDEPKPKVGRKGRSSTSSGGKPGKAKNGAKGARGPGRKRKKDESEEEEDDSAEEEESEEEEPKKRGKKPKKEYDSEEEDSGEGESSATPAKKGGSSAKNFPDKQGFLSLYIFRGDLVNGIKANENLCLWRRDGSSLLQKYLRDKSSTEVQWSPSMVYSCWEDRRKDEYLEVKVLCKGDLKNSNVTIVNLEELEQQCIIDRDENAKFVSHKDQQAAANQSVNNTTIGNTTQEDVGDDDGEEE